MHWQNLSGENAPKVHFCSKKWNYSKSNEFARKKSITNHDSFWYQKLLNITFMSNTHFDFFWELTNMLILAKMLVPYCKMKSQQIQHFNMVHPRDILLAKSIGNSRLFYMMWCKILILGTWKKILFTEVNFERFFLPKRDQ